MGLSLQSVESDTNSGQSVSELNCRTPGWCQINGELVGVGKKKTNSSLRQSSLECYKRARNFNLILYLWCLSYSILICLLPNAEFRMHWAIKASLKYCVIILERNLFMESVMMQWKFFRQAGQRSKAQFQIYYVHPFSILLSPPHVSCYVLRM